MLKLKSILVLNIVPKIVKKSQVKTRIKKTLKSIHNKL